MTASVPVGNTYDKYASQNPIERRLMQRFFAALDASLPSSRPARVLEVGVGEAHIAGRVVERYGELPIAGVDLPDPGLAAEWAASSIDGSFADIVDLPFADDQFDLVLAIEVLEHVSDPTAALGEIARVANDRVVLSVPREPIWRIANLARGKYFSDLGNTPGHIQHWSQKAFRRLVAQHFEVLEVSAPFPWTMVAAQLR